MISPIWRDGSRPRYSITLFPSMGARIVLVELLFGGELFDTNLEVVDPVRDRERARRWLRVVTSHRTSSLRSSSSGPASRTYRRTAESVHPIL